MDARKQPAIQLDGAQGEDGGQLLRSALSLAMITGRSFVIERFLAVEVVVEEERAAALVRIRANAPAAR